MYGFGLEMHTNVKKHTEIDCPLFVDIIWSCAECSYSDPVWINEHHLFIYPTLHWCEIIPQSRSTRLLPDDKAMSDINSFVERNRERPAGSMTRKQTHLIIGACTVDAVCLHMKSLESLSYQIKWLNPIKSIKKIVCQGKGLGAY